MTSTVINPSGLTLYDVSTQTKTKTIVGLMKEVLPTNPYIKVNPGKSYCKYLLPNRDDDLHEKMKFDLFNR
jgi:hypothetical protein